MFGLIPSLRVGWGVVFRRRKTVTGHGRCHVLDRQGVGLCAFGQACRRAGAHAEAWYLPTWLAAVQSTPYGAASASALWGW